MSISQAEVIVDRRQLKRRLFRWRILAILAVLLALGALFWSGGDFKKHFDHIARIHIDGLITGDEATLNLLDDLAKSNRVKGVIIRIDSPGGTTAGSEAIYEKIRKIAKDKPVVAVMDTVAASGGYITAIAADHIVARGNTITGSIGVIFQLPEVSKLLDTLGIRMEEIKSGELKAEPTPYKPMSDRVRQVSNEMVQESFAWFTGLVVERRKLSARTGEGSGRRPRLYRPPGGHRKAHRRPGRRRDGAGLAPDAEEAPEGHRDCRLAQSLGLPAPRAWAFPWPTRCLKP